MKELKDIKRKYFTQVPNYILDNLTIWEREVYIQIKKIAGEDGTCWTSQKTLAKQCGMSINRLKQSIKSLIEKKYIKYIGKKKLPSSGGLQKTNEYSIIDIWELNNSFYRNKRSKGLSQNKLRTIINNIEGVSLHDDKEEPYIIKTLKEEDIIIEKNNIKEIIKVINGKMKLIPKYSKNSP